MAGKKRKFACAVNIDTLSDFDCYFDLLGSLILVLDKKGNITLFNSGAEEILGYKAEDVLGKNWIDNFVPKETRKQVKAVFDSMVSGKQEFIERYTNEVLHKSGRKITLQWHSSAIKNEKGKIEGVIASAVEVTNLINIESDLQEKIAQLEKVNNLMVGRELKMVELKERLMQYEK